MPKKSSLRRVIRLGFVALSDCAPIVMAAELGLFARHGVEVELHREVGWATIRDKIIYGELEAAHAPAGLVVAANCGLGSIQAECVSALMISLNGNAITLSEGLWKLGVRDGEGLRQAVARGDHRYTFAVVHPYSAHHVLLRLWLRQHGIHPERDVRIVVVPPAQVHANLKAGHLDGYCVGEPWNSMAVLSGHGWTVATSEELAPRHPEKALLVRKDFADHFPQEHLGVVAALIESCGFCQKPENRERLLETLSQPGYVGAPIQALRMSMAGTYDYGHGRLEKHSTFHVFAGAEVNTPSADKARWVIDHLISSGVVKDPTLIPDHRAADWFRTDLFAQASQLLSTTRS